jgi:hypothetical protein
MTVFAYLASKSVTYVPGLNIERKFQFMYSSLLQFSHTDA